MNYTQRYINTSLLVLITSLATLHAEVHKVQTMAEYNSLLAQGKPVFIDVSTSWCGPCKQFKPTFEKLSDEYPDVIFIELDGDNGATKSAHNASSYPTFIFLDSKGNQVDRFSGALLEKIRKNLNKISGKAACPTPAPAQKAPPPVYKKPMETAKPKHVDSAVAAPVVVPMESSKEGRMKKETQKKESRMKKEKAPKKKDLIRVTSAEQFTKVVIESNKKTVIHFKAPNCPQCDDLGLALAHLAQDEQYESLQFITIETDNKNLKNIIGQPGLLALPSYTWLFKGMSELKGITSEDMLLMHVKTKLMEAYNISMTM